jgi:arylsulfatase A-like enzyme
MLSIPTVIYQMWFNDNDDALQALPSSTSENISRPNFILVTFDTLTARDMSAYGYHRPTTPFITKWAESATLFTRMYAADNATKPTTSTLMTGKREWTHRTYHNIEGSSGPLKGSTENMARVLRKNGYKTMAFIVNPMAAVSTLGIEESFDIAPIPTEFHSVLSLNRMVEKKLYELFGDKFDLYNWLMKSDFVFLGALNLFSRTLTDTEVPPENAFNSFLSIGSNNMSTPYFAWIHLLPPHSPHLPPKQFKGIYSSSVKKEQIQPGRWDFMRAEYDEFINYCDKEFEEFILKLNKSNDLENTIIIFSSDHGESFEHNTLQHNKKDLYEQVTHIPFIIKEPDQTEPRIVHDIAEQIDIPATILDLAHIPLPSWMDGRSLKALLRDEKLEPRPAFSMHLAKNFSSGQDITKGTVAVWSGDFKLIHFLDEDRSLLFDITSDPDEIEDLYNEKPNVGQVLLRLVLDNLEKANEKNRTGK